MSNNSQRRHDGRTSDSALRPLSCETSCLQNCDGSCTWQSGETSILATVHGPVAPKQYQYEDYNNAIVSVVIKSGYNIGIYERELEKFVSKMLVSCICTEQYPRCIISITAQILTSDGSVLSSIIHACVVALMDASIELLYLPVSVCTSFVLCNNSNDGKDNDDDDNNNSNRIQLEPTNVEEQIAQAVMTTVFISNRRDEFEAKDTKNDSETSATEKIPSVQGCHTSAGMHMSPSEVIRCITFASRAVHAVHAFYRLAIEQKVKRELQTISI
jgi:ribonuclease PH